MKRKRKKNIEQEKQVFHMSVSIDKIRLQCREKNQ